MTVHAVEVVREVFRRYDTGEDPFPLLDEEIIWEVPMIEGTYRGHRGVAEYFRNWIRTWDDHRIVLEELQVAPDGRVLALFCEEGSGRGSGVPVHLHPASLWEVRHGKAISYRGYLDRDQGARAAGLQP